jgi:Spy/CpxP family protein refolding chaperone
MKRKLLILLAAIFLIGSFSVTSLSANQPTKKAKPFLIQGKLPHLTGVVKMFWDDEDLALTSEQKEKLLVVRKYTMTQAQKLGKQIIALENKIVKASNEGVNEKAQEDDVYKLAKLRAKATVVHLKCIYDTRKILTKKQLSIIE